MADENLGEEQTTDDTEGKSVENSGDKDAGTGGDDASDKSKDDKSADDKSADKKSEDTSDKSAEEKSEEKSEEDKSEEDDKSEDDKSKDKSEGAPEEYANFTLPENVTVNEERLTSFTDFARTHDLSQKAAQELVDLHLETVGEVAAQQQEQWDTIKEGWAKETKANKNLHDEKGNADAAIAAARGAAEKLGGEKLLAAMDLTGFGDHPTAVEVFHKISQAMAEDEFIFGSGSADTRTQAEKMYPSMKPKKK